MLRKMLLHTTQRHPRGVYSILEQVMDGRQGQPPHARRCLQALRAVAHGQRQLNSIVPVS